MLQIISRFGRPIHENKSWKTENWPFAEFKYLKKKPTIQHLMHETNRIVEWIWWHLHRNTKYYEIMWSYGHLFTLHNTSLHNTAYWVVVLVSPVAAASSVMYNIMSTFIHVYVCTNVCMNVCIHAVFTMKHPQITRSYRLLVAFTQITFESYITLFMLDAISPSLFWFNFKVIIPTYLFTSGIARPGPTRACALSSIFLALPITSSAGVT